MWKLIISILFIPSVVLSQFNLQSNEAGKKEVIINENGFLNKKIILNPIPFNGNVKYNDNFKPPFTLNSGNNTNVRWSYTEPTAIGDFCAVSGNGKYNVTGWDLNSERVSFYGNLNSTPIWEFTTDPEVFINFVTISDTGGVIGVGSYRNIYLFSNINNTPFFNFDLTTLADTGFATSLDLTNDGRFLVCSASRNDSSTIFGFNSTSSIPVWSRRIVPTITAGGGAIQGIRISGNDSLVMVNTYAEYFIIRTFTGQLVYQGLINPNSPSSGTQSPQGISGDGRIIAIINYFGNLTVYQWNGTTYSFLWQNQEPPGMFYNWYYTVDVTYDGNYISAGTLNFITSSSYDGKVKVFKTTTGATPMWTYAGCGDNVTAVSFSRSGNILAASSWGEFNNLSEDLYIFKTFLGNVPIFKINSPGSLFWCNTSKDGRTVVGSGKAVHARQFGNGGLLFNVDVDTNDIPTSINNQTGLLNEFKLHQNYPNPFNPSTVISYELQVTSYIKLKLFDINGKKIKELVNGKQNAGSYEIKFDGSDLSSGIYFYKLETEKYNETKRMILLK